MKSTEVYATLREHLAPAFKENGFARAKSMLAWKRAQGSAFLVVWCQVSQSGWDTYAGSKFTMEFQLSASDMVGAAVRGRWRIGSLVSESALEEILEIQNSVIASLSQPPAAYLMQFDDRTQAYYLRQFEPVAVPYATGTDIWMRYGTKAHVEAWAGLILRVLPECIEAACSNLGS